MKKKELKAKLDRTQFREVVMQIELAHACRSIEKLRGDLAALQLELDTKTDELEALQVATCAEVTELKTQYANACEINAHQAAQIRAQVFGQQWVPVEDGVTGDADGGMMLTVSDNGAAIMLRDDSPGCKEFEMGESMRICRKAQGAVVGTTNEDKDKRIAELEAQLEQAQSSAHRYYKLYTSLQSDVDKRRRQEEEQAAWLEQEMARLKDEGF